MNDLAVAIREMQAVERIQRAMVIDCDLHQGNGTARLFQGDSSVFTFPMHQRDLYPVKEESSFDIHLNNGVRDEEYLELMHSRIPGLIDKFQPPLILYQAGADPYKEDQLGQLQNNHRGFEKKRRTRFRMGP
jgi:acetoin utilization deacetylase AcuC-like enzyme